jgi:hypothetical protein
VQRLISTILYAGHASKKVCFSIRIVTYNMHMRQFKISLLFTGIY